MPYDGWIVVGLGNPGPSYAQTRHNLGYLVTDELVRRMGASWKAHKSGRLQVVEGRLGGTPGLRTVLGRGRCYMNESGGPVSTLLNFYKATPEQLIVVYDEIDIPFAELRLKFGGGDGGHNGARSVRAALGTGDFYRVRAGVGRPPGRQDAADYVLRPFSSTERRELDLHVARAADAVEALMTAGLTTAQNTYHA
jgi:PTH1 family peptidyl-tRNA hydrolase